MFHTHLPTQQELYDANNLYLWIKDRRSMIRNSAITGNTIVVEALLKYEPNVEIACEGFIAGGITQDKEQFLKILSFFQDAKLRSQIAHGCLPKENVSVLLARADAIHRYMSTMLCTYQEALEICLPIQPSPEQGWSLNPLNLLSSAASFFSARMPSFWSSTSNNNNQKTTPKGP